MAKIAISDILTAFDEKTIGTKVINKTEFLIHLSCILDRCGDSVIQLGQKNVALTETEIRHISSGIGKRTDNPDDYILRSHRGRVQTFLKREKAAPVIGASIIVYSEEEYLKDPEVIGTPEYDRIRAIGCDYVIVAVLSRSGNADPSLSAFRFVSNLAGNNNGTLKWTIEEVRKMAKEVLEYEDEWSVVAD